MYTERSLNLKGKDVTEKMKQKLFFPVDRRPLFWQPVNESSDRLKKCIPYFYAIVDLEREYVFSTVTSTYSLVSNEEAYKFGVYLAKKLLHIENNEDLKCIRATLTANRARCSMDICRFTDYFQPLMNEGWYSFLSIENSYNKTKCVEYSVGFYNEKYEYGLPFFGLSINTKNTHEVSWEYIQKKIIKKIDKESINIEWIEQSFYNKIKALKNIPISKENILPMYCRIFNIDRKWLIKNSDNKDLAAMKDYIDKSADELTEHYGQNAYALLNVLADIQYEYYDPRYKFTFIKNKNTLGKWVDEFIKESTKPDFSLSKYIGEPAMDAADWLRTNA